MGKRLLSDFGEGDAEDGGAGYINDCKPGGSITYRSIIHKPCSYLFQKLQTFQHITQSYYTERHCQDLQDGALGNRPRNRGLRAAKKRQPEPSRPY
jgi:hypothetical protein